LDPAASASTFNTWGRFWPSQRLEEIPSEKIKTEFRFRDGPTALYVPYLQAPVFTDLAVRWSDLIKHRRALLGQCIALRAEVD